jgi:hypothetical protein
MAQTESAGDDRDTRLWFPNANRITPPPNNFDPPVDNALRPAPCSLPPNTAPVLSSSSGGAPCVTLPLS